MESSGPENPENSENKFISYEDFKKWLKGETSSVELKSEIDLDLMHREAMNAWAETLSEERNLPMQREHGSGFFIGATGKIRIEELFPLKSTVSETELIRHPDSKISEFPLIMQLIGRRPNLDAESLLDNFIKQEEYYDSTVFIVETYTPQFFNSIELAKLICSLEDPKMLKAVLVKNEKGSYLLMRGEKSFLPDFNSSHKYLNNFYESTQIQILKNGQEDFTRFSKDNVEFVRNLNIMRDVSRKVWLKQVIHDYDLRLYVHHSNEKGTIYKRSEEA